MKHKFCALLLALVAPIVYAHHFTQDDKHYECMVEESPHFPGGEKACVEWINARIKYPKIAMKEGIQGRVLTSFMVNCDGTISDIEVIRSPHPSLSKEVIRIVKHMPKWKPGKLKGEVVRMKYTLPIMFLLPQQ